MGILFKVLRWPLTVSVFRTVGLHRTAAATLARNSVAGEHLLCDYVRTPPVESSNDSLAAALTEGLARMSTEQGTDDLKAWRWDNVHHAQFPHNPFDADPQSLNRRQQPQLKNNNRRQHSNDRK